MYRLSPYLKNKASRLIKSPKLYLTDSGVASYLMGLDRVETTFGDLTAGPLLETYVAQNLRSILEARVLRARFHFWSVQGRYEVDFVVEAGNRCIAVEAKSGGRWQERDLSGLRAFLNGTPQCVAAILAYNGRDSVRLADKLWAIPLGLLIS
jgi:hypothetical protein